MNPFPPQVALVSPVSLASPALVVSKALLVCLETQAYPDAVNHDNFPGVILSPGQVYTHVCKYKFSWKK